jgi:hypothetical protein
MNETPQPDPDERVGISLRLMDITVALLLLVVGAVVAYDSHRLGSSWGSDGPESGYFPFRVGILICVASLVTIVQAVRARNLSYVMFVSLARLKLVMTVLIPALVYVFFVQYVGLYVASAVYIALFMVWLGKYSWLRGILVGVLVNVSFFLMFEVWFKVPLWKGDLDPLRFLGY